MTATNNILIKWSLAFKVGIFILVLTVLKITLYYFDYEVMDLNPLFTSLVAGTIFIIGFLVNGVLSDYKESEKIPSEIAAICMNLQDDSETIAAKQILSCTPFVAKQKEMQTDLIDWLYRKKRTGEILEKIASFNTDLIDMEKEGLQPPYLIKIKNELSSLRKLILRIDTIRDTDFVSSAYTIVEAMGFFVMIGLLAIKITPFYASLFLTVVVSFLLIYMYFLIKDLDNPFDYSEKGESGSEVSLKPLHDLLRNRK